MSIATVEKAFVVLEYLASTGKAASLQEVTKAARLPKPTTYRLLRSLESMGYVERPPESRNYLVGPRAARLAAPEPHSHLKAVATPLLQQLHKQFNETANLGVLSGERVLYLEFIQTTQALRFIVVPGESDHYYYTALGRAIVSSMDDENLKRLIAKTKFQHRTPHTVRTHAELLRKITTARTTGVAEESEEAVEGVSCLAVNLKNLGFPNAAISVAVPSQRLTARRRQEIIRLLKKTALLSKK